MSVNLRIVCCRGNDQTEEEQVNWQIIRRQKIIKFLDILAGKEPSMNREKSDDKQIEEHKKFR